MVGRRTPAGGIARVAAGPPHRAQQLAALLQRLPTVNTIIRHDHVTPLDRADAQALAASALALGYAAQRASGEDLEELAGALTLVLAALARHGHVVALQEVRLSATLLELLREPS